MATRRAVARKAGEAEVILGLPAGSPEAWVATIRAGLPYSTLARIQRRWRLTEREVAESVDIHPRTLMRRKSQERLRPDESDRVSRVARVLAQATRVLGSKENAVAWLRHPNGALGGTAPLSYLNTDVGARRVEALLAHIDYGDLS